MTVLRIACMAVALLVGTGLAGVMTVESPRLNHWLMRAFIVEGFLFFLVALIVAAIGAWRSIP